jgi:5-methylcytosine-specific restriction endonuclease McrA
MDESTRDFVRDRANGRCEYCLLPEDADEWPFHIDHVVAKQHGGDEHVENLCLACIRCNVRKGTNLASIDPRTGERAQLFDPRRDRWADHFALRNARIVGLTMIGRCTVRLLRMTDYPRLEVRRELIADGRFEI